jgi:hypothetical protein
VEDVYEVCQYREFLLRKHLTLCTADLKILELDDANKFLAWHEDETIRERIEMYGAGGTDITDPKAGEGSAIYRKWRDLKWKEAHKYEYEEIVDKTEIERAEKTFEMLNDELFGKIKLAEQGINFNGRI